MVTLKQGVGGFELALGPNQGVERRREREREKKRQEKTETGVLTIVKMIYLGANSWLIYTIYIKGLR